MNAAAAFGRTEREKRGRNVSRLFVVLGLAAFSIVLVLSTLTFLWVPTSDVGLSLDGDVVTGVAPGYSADRAGLRVGDRLAGNTPFFVRQSLGKGTSFWPARYSFDVIRQGRSRHVSMSLANFNFDYAPKGARLVLFGVTILAFLMCAAMGTLILLINASRATWSFFLFCIGGMMPILWPRLLLDAMPMPGGFVLQLARMTLVVVGIFAILDFALHFPSGETRGWKGRIAALLPAFAGACWAWNLFLWSVQFYPPLFHYPDAAVDIAIRVAISLLAVFSVIATYRSSALTVRPRLKWAILGVVLGCAALALRAILADTSWIDGLEWLVWITILAGFLAPLAVAYAIFRHRVIDVRFVLNRALVYLVVMSLLAVVLASTYWIANFFLQRAGVAVLVQLPVAIVAGVLLHRIYQRLDSGINRLLFRHRHAAQEQLGRLAAGLPQAESIAELERLVVWEPVVALDLACGALYQRSENSQYERRAGFQADFLPKQLADDEPLIVRMRTYRESLSLSSRLLETIGSALQDQPLAFALRLYPNDALGAIVVYGPHADGSDLDPKEKSAIQALQSPAARAYATLTRQSKKLRELSELCVKAPADACDDLHLYLAGEILDAIPDRSKAAIIACAAIPDATDGDVRCATKDRESVELLREFAVRSPVVSRTERETFVVHGLLARVIGLRYADRCREMRVLCARRASEMRERSRAADLFALAGLKSASAEELEQLLSEENSAILIPSSVEPGGVPIYDFELVRQRPHLWIQRSAMRIYRDAMAVQIRESQFVRDTCNAAGVLQPSMLSSWCAYLRAEAGELASATARLESPGEARPSPFALALRAFAASLVAGRSGRIGDCTRQLAHFSESLIDEFRALRSLVRASLVERMLGRWNQERAELDLAIDALKSSGSRFVVWALAEGVVGAWFAGQEQARRAYLKLLDAAIPQYGAPAFVPVTTASTDEPYAPTDAESPRWRTYGYLIAAAAAAAWRDASAYAALALAAAIDAGEPFLQLLARVACAEFDGENRYEHLRQALELSDALESPALAASVRAYIANDDNAGMLEHFLVRMRQERTGDGAPLTVELASGSVRRGAQVVKLSERELAVVMAVAWSPKALSSLELTELIWSDLDEAAGSHATQTCIHRLRQRLGDSSVVQSTPHGYRLRDDVLIDTREIAAFMQSVKTDDQLSELSALRLAAVVKHLDNSRPAFMASWEWFLPIECRIEEWSRTAKLRLAKDAMRRKAYHRALQIAQQVIARDELDEPAWEIAICALLESGDRAAAQRELRRYREITQRELRSEPSKELCDLVESTQPKPQRTLRVVGSSDVIER